jgi:hypothetical protein
VRCDRAIAATDHRPAIGSADRVVASRCYASTNLRLPDRRVNQHERMRMSESLGLLRRGPISPAVHGTLDYLLAATLIAAPLVLHYHDETAKVIMLVLGGAATVLAVGTNWSRGIVRVLPPVVHGVADIGATIALIIAPFVFAFSDHTLALVVYVAVGAGGLLATLLTRFESDLQPATRRRAHAPNPV